MAISRGDFRLTLPAVQNFIAGIVLLGTVGIYIAITALGAGGGAANSTEMNYIVSSTLYGTFAVTGFFGGSVINRFGPRWSVMVGAFGYPFYVSGLCYFDHESKLAYAITGGAVLGLCAGQLWAGVIYVALAYADENSKGRLCAIQAAMKATGNLIASALGLGINAHNKTSPGAPLSVYIAFICIMLATMCVALLLVKPDRVRRKDGTALAVFERDSFLEEFKGITRLVYDSKAMLLAPCLAVAEFQLILQPGISAKSFDLRTRGLLAFIATVVEHAKIGIFLIASLIIGTYSGEAGWLFSVIPSAEPESKPAYDWTESSFAGFFAIFVIFNLLNAVAPVYVAWLLSSLTNDPKESGAYAGLLRSIMAGGTAIGFGIAAADLIWVAFTYVTDTNYGLEGMVNVPENVLGGIEKTGATRVSTQEVKMDELG